MVIGGGVAGLCAAFVAKESGMMLLYMKQAKSLAEICPGRLPAGKR